MVPFIAAVIAVIGIGFGAALALEGFQSTSDKTYQTGGVRLDPDMGQPSLGAAAHKVEAAAATKPAVKQ
jgi:hypothetical protein